MKQKLPGRYETRQSKIAGFKYSAFCIPAISAILNTPLYFPHLQYYIHLCKYKGEDVFFVDFVKYVKVRLLLEKTHEINQLDHFRKGWQEFYDHL